MKNCNFIYLGDNEKLSFSDEKDFIDFLNNNKERVLNTRSSVRFSKELDPQLEAISAIQNISESGNTTIITNTLDILTLGEKYSSAGGEKTIQASKIHTMKQTNKDAPLVSPMSYEDFKQEKYKKLIGKVINPDTKELYTKGEVDQLIETMIDNWGTQAKLGTEVHYMAEVFFSEEDPSFKDFVENFKAKYPQSTASESVLKETYTGLVSIKSRLLSLHPGGKFLSEVSVLSDENKSGWKVTGVIDLIVVDSEGTPHIYDFKTSTKSLQEFSQIKKLTYAYLLLAYKHILASKGINTTKTSLNVIPITLDDIDFETNTIGAVTIDASELDHLDVTHGTHISPGGYMYANINAIIPIKLTGFRVGSDYLDNSVDMVKLAFNYDVKLGQIKDDYDNLMEQSKRSKTFYNKMTGSREYFEEDPSTLIKLYLEMLSNSQFTQATTVSRNISKILDGSMTIEDVFKNESYVRMYESRFGKYYNSGWRLIGDFEHLGILALANDELKTIDFISITLNDISKLLDLLVGKRTLLGNYIRDEKVIDRDILENNVGNAELIKLMFFINNLYQTNNVPEGYSIGSLNVYEAGKLSKGLHQPPELLLKTFNHVVKALNENGQSITNSLYTNANLFTSYEDSIIHELNSLTAGTLPNNITKNFNNKQADILKRLYELQASILRLVNIHTDDYTTPVGRLSFLVNQAILHFNNILLLNNVEDYGKWNVLSSHGGTSFQHTPTATDDITYKFEKNVLDIARRQIINKTSDFLEKSRKAIDKFKQGKFMMGSGDNSFDNCFVQVNGKFDNTLIVKNPYQPDPSLKPEEIEYLKFFLESINAVRFGTTDINSDKAKEAISSGSWFEVPLMRGGFRNRLSSGQGITSTIKDFYDEQLNLNKMIDQNQKKLENDVALKFEDVINPLGVTGQVRLLILDTKGTSYFSRDLNSIVNQFVALDIKTAQYNQVLPIIRASLIYHKAHTNIDNIQSDEYNKYLLAYFRKQIYNVLDIDDSLKSSYATISAVKSVVSKATLAFNFASMVGETSLGIYNNFIRFHTKSFGKDAPTVKNLMKGYALCSGQITSTYKHYSKLNALNFIFLITDINVNNMAENAGGLTNSLLGKYSNGDLTLKMNQFSEFLNKLSIMLAYMDRDGTFDAYIWKDNVLSYNWRKDKRFEVYARYKGKETSIPNHLKELYQKEKGRYYYIVENLAREGVVNKETGQKISYNDDITCPYTSLEIASMKNVASLVHGYLDPNQLIPFKNTMLGSMILMFKSYITAKKELWTLAGNTYSQGTVKEKIDPITGDKIYVHEVYDGEGNVIRTYEDNNPEGGVTSYEFIPQYQEGILLSFAKLAQAAKDGEFMKEWKENEIARANTWLALKDALNALAMLILGWFVQDTWTSDTSSTEKRYTRKLLQATQGNNIFTMILTLYDGSNPALFLIFANMYEGVEAIVKTPTPTTVLNSLSRNIGAVRTGKEIYSAF